MILIGRDGSEVGVNIIAYEFEKATDYQSANWLEVIFRIRNSEGHGWCQAPCLLTWEVVALAAWLRDRSLGHPPTSVTEEYMVFQEPNLQFHFEGQSDEGVTLTVTYNLEQPGEWVPSTYLAHESAWSGTMRLTVPHVQLGTAAIDLEQQMLDFPIRKNMSLE